MACERCEDASKKVKLSSLSSLSYVSREEMIQLLKNSIVKQTTDEDADEGVKDLVDITLKKMDDDKDGRLSFVDFKKAVEVSQSVFSATFHASHSQKYKALTLIAMVSKMCCFIATVVLIHSRHGAISSQTWSRFKAIMLLIHSKHGAVSQ